MGWQIRVTRPKILLVITAWRTKAGFKQEVILFLKMPDF